MDNPNRGRGPGQASWSSRPVSSSRASVGRHRHQTIRGSASRTTAVRSTVNPRNLPRDRFLTIPQDVFHIICEYLHYGDILQLVLTNSYFATFERDLLLHPDLADGGCRALSSAVSRGNLQLAEKCLKLGYNPNHGLEAGAQVDGLIKMPQKKISVFHNRHVRNRHVRRWVRSDVFIPFSLPALVVLKNDIDMLELFCRYGADFGGMGLVPVKMNSTPTGHGTLNALHLARSPRMIESVLLLVPVLGGTKGDDGEPLLMWHVERGMAAGGLHLILKAGAHPDGTRLIPQPQRGTGFPCLHRTPLEAAIFYSDVDAVKTLLRWGATLEYQEPMFSLLTRVYSSSIHPYLLNYLFRSKQSLEASREIFNLCLDHGLDFTLEFLGSSLDPIRTLFQHSLDRGTADLLRHILQTGADPHEPRLKSKGNEFKSKTTIDPVLWLLDFIAAEADNGHYDEGHRTARILELSQKLRILAEHRPFKDIQYPAFFRVIVKTPMRHLEMMLHVVHRAFGSFAGSFPILSRLLGRCQVLGLDSSILRPCVAFLVQHGADTNARLDGNTPLHQAFMLPKIEEHEWELKRQDNILAMILHLLLHGADPALKDDQGKSAFWHARNSGWLDLDLPKACVIRYILEEMFKDPHKVKDDLLQRIMDAD